MPRVQPRICDDENIAFLSWKQSIPRNSSAFFWKERKREKNSAHYLKACEQRTLKTKRNKTKQKQQQQQQQQQQTKRCRPLWKKTPMCSAPKLTWNAPHPHRLLKKWRITWIHSFETIYTGQLGLASLTPASLRARGRCRCK